MTISLLPGRLVWRILLAMGAVLLVAALVAGSIATTRVQEDARTGVVRSLEEHAVLLAELARHAIVHGETQTLQARVRDLPASRALRYTIVAADGTVLADSERDPATMDDHRRRPEILASRDEPFGVATRYSATVRRDLVYVARRVEQDGALVAHARAAMPLVTLDRRLDRLAGYLGRAAVVAMVLALLLAVLLSQRIVRPLREMTRTARAIADGDLDRPIATSEPGEVGELARAVRRMTDQLRDRLRVLARDREELRTILAGMVEGVLATDGEERVVLINEAAAAMLGVEVDAATGAPVWEAVRVAHVGDVIAEAVAAGAPRNAEARIVGGGTERTLQLLAAPLRGEDGAPVGAVLVLHDISELRRLEQVRRDFVANASHELRTPISSLRGLIETILDDDAMEEATRRRFLARALRQTEYLGDMVEELLALSRLESEPEAEPAEIVDLREPVAEALEAAAPLARERQVTLDVDLGDTAARVQGRSEALRRVTTNLLDNAIKYAPAGSSVRLGIVARGEAVRLEVSDAGPGIPRDKQDRIFERFYRVDEGRSRHVGGTGLGLAIVKHLVQSMRGRVGVRSEPGRGSTFWVSFPAS